MDKESVVYTHHEVLFNHKEKNYIIYRKMDGTGDHHVEISESQTQKTKIKYFLSYVQSGFKREREREMKIERRLFGKRKETIKRERGDRKG
jgi:hypothetical protein